MTSLVQPVVNAEDICEVERDTFFIDTVVCTISKITKGDETTLDFVLSESYKEAYLNGIIN